MKLLSLAAETIRRYRMFQPGQRVGAAVSGGADSVCLLHVLRELAPQWDLRLSLLHLNHGLRGEESRQDEQFVRDLAARLGIEATIRAVDVAASADNLEQAARYARLTFFREQLAAGEVARIATGHTANDQAETVLFRFLRGSGGAGLAAIRPVTAEGIVRPLLAAGRADVEQYLRERGIAWREDSSNASLAIRAQSHPPPVAAATGPRMESGHRRDPEPRRRLGAGRGGILGGGNRPRGCRMSDGTGRCGGRALRRLYGNCRWPWLAGWCAMPSSEPKATSGVWISPTLPPF